MTPRQKKGIVFAAIPSLAAAGIVLDLFTPLGVADWVWYFIPLLLSVYVGGRLFPYLLAAVFSALTALGFFLALVARESDFWPIRYSNYERRRKESLKQIRKRRDR